MTECTASFNNSRMFFKIDIFKYWFRNYFFMFSLNKLYKFLTSYTTPYTTQWNKLIVLPVDIMANAWDKFG